MKRVLLLLVSLLLIIGTFAVVEQSTVQAGPIRWIINHIFPQPQPVPPDPVPPTPEPVPPTPEPTPVPPEPIKGLRVLLTGPGPRSLRDLTPDQAATTQSRPMMDWFQGHCEVINGLPAFRKMPRALALTDADFKTLAEASPADAIAFVVARPDKAPLVVPVGKAFETLKQIAGYAGVELPMFAAAPPKPLREFTAAEWATFKGQNGVAVVGGKKRFLSAKPRDLKKHPYGAAPGTVRLAEAGVRVIPRSEWPARLDALKAANAGLMPLMLGKHSCHDQAQTNYCWANGPTGCGDTLLYTTGRGNYRLSAASVGGPVTGYRNQGGWPTDAIAYMARYGAVRDTLWPNADIDSSYATKAEVKADYPNHLVSSTIADLGADNPIFEETVTCVLLGCPVATSHNWWSHAVMAVGLDYSDGVWYLIERNSWGMDYGTEGFFKLREGGGSNQAGPDDAQVILWLGQKQ